MNTSEYNSCVTLYADGVYRFVYKNLRDADGSKDIVQEAFARLWGRRGDVDASKAKSYIFTAAYHLIIDGSRKIHESPMPEGYDTYQTAFRQYSGIKEVLDAAIAKLPSDQRCVIMLRDYEGYSYDEIAEITGLSLSQVKVYIFRGRTFLRRQLESQGIFSANMEEAV